MNRGSMVSKYRVSIHAPAGGATSIAFPPRLRRESFNPRARGGRDFPQFWAMASARRFNPRARGGRDVCGGVCMSEDGKFQSTRPRGARRLLPVSCVLALCFNPRARGGRDKAAPTFATGTALFQSTRPRGARHAGQNAPNAIRSFNPRARGGRDIAERAKAIFLFPVSIHAPAGGATSSYTDYQRDFWFQSTRPRGARHQKTVDGLVLIAFQSTRPRGARRMKRFLAVRRMMFQSTRPRGARRR